MKIASTFIGKLIVEERLLIVMGMIGFLLAAICAVYVVLYGGVVLPEGNVESAFSFNAAIAIFILSMAAILVVSDLKPSSRKWIRWGLAATVLIGYGIETIQHFRGINPRFTQVGTTTDMLVGMFFGLISLVLIILTVLVAISFFRKRDVVQQPILILSIRYAFLSTMISFAAGICMSVLHSRYTGSAGNFIVLHGLGFHALQTLPVLGWLIEQAGANDKRARVLLHLGGVSWLSSIIFVGIQTLLGRTTFEMSLLPIIAVAALLVWSVALITSYVHVRKCFFSKGNPAGMNVDV
ncbi:hypothetical protein [Lederbergia panacisoli]|uniref:hypothetical protein n=1 Tax=Lederbergia panacisoli TaxID=1255251 RepID=UPI00214B114B|nr:hypothetical protein [Lederbergia panacisoli]MCR2823674.1 hypothetical protein [Lederbergia panacisoli]